MEEFTLPSIGASFTKWGDVEASPPKARPLPHIFGKKRLKKGP
jgi:hypothetical protein